MKNINSGFFFLILTFTSIDFIIYKKNRFGDTNEKN